ncbi:contactin-associated protein-like 2 [Phacochoerus africanus]|uniref:contactin-associated protein-like 2 n=1 Tax=Phacochoerus africanus TaxID=41426 RepID=UPI001FD90430|nr:contactin-associated protein-like 2 [Phacochoerus africanus]
MGHMDEGEVTIQVQTVLSVAPPGGQDEKDVGAFFEEGMWLRYNFQAPGVNAKESGGRWENSPEPPSTAPDLAREEIHFSFSTTKAPCILLYVSSLTTDFLAVLVKPTGSLQIRYNLGGTREPYNIDVEHRNMANGQPHSVNITRHEKTIILKESLLSSQVTPGQSSTCAKVALGLDSCEWPEALQDSHLQTRKQDGRQDWRERDSLCSSSALSDEVTGVSGWKGGQNGAVYHVPSSLEVGLDLRVVRETGKIDQEIHKYNTPGFTGCLSRVQFNQIAPLKAALRQTNASAHVHVQGELVESNCGASPLTLSPMSSATDPWHLDHLDSASADFPYNPGQGQAIRNGVNRNSAIIGGVIAVVIFTILCTLVFLIRYMFRHKGTYHTNEAKGAESAESADAAIMNNDPNFTETIDESKKEWLI